MKQTCLYLLLVLSLSSCNGCKDEDNTPSALPPATDTGAGTFGCMVDNRAFVPHKSIFAYGKAFDYMLEQYEDGRSSLSLFASSDKDSSLSLNMYLDSVRLQSGASYTLGQPGSSISLRKSTFTYIAKMWDAPGTLLVRRYDSAAGIVSGSFWFDGIDTFSRRRIRVSEGRFDIKVR